MSRFRRPRWFIPIGIIVVLIIVGIIVGTKASGSAVEKAVRSNLSQTPIAGDFTNLKCPSISDKKGTLFSCTLRMSRPAAGISSGTKLRLAFIVTGESGNIIHFQPHPSASKYISVVN